MNACRFIFNGELAALPHNSADGIKSELAHGIVGLLDRKGLTVRAAGLIAATPAADFSRIRQGKLGRFTVDRLIAILTRLDQSLEVSVDITQRRGRAQKSGRGDR